jgi:outer membrane receptor protein involved in Fe transport
VNGSVGSGGADGSPLFNYAPFNYNQVPQVRYQATAFGHYDLAEWVTFYGEAHFSQTEIDSVIAPSGTFFSVFDIPFDSIYLSPQAQSVLFDFDQNGIFDDDVDLDGDIDGDDPSDVASFLFGRRTTEVGPRITRNRTQAWQIVAGFKGEIPGTYGWSYDFSVQRGRTELSRIFQNDISGLRAQDLLTSSSPSAAAAAGASPPVDGGPCAVASRTGCVLGSLFGEDSLNSAAARYMSLQINEEVYTTQDVVHFDVGGDFGETFKIPGASPIGASFGAEWRRVESESYPDDCYINPDCSIGFGSVTPVQGDIEVKEFFGEVRVPVLEDLPFAKNLTLSAAYRWADYSHSGTADAWNVGGEYSPIDDLRLRVSYQRAVRAPNVYETFQPVTPELDNSNGDPCSGFGYAGGIVPNGVRDQCVADGAPAARFTPVVGGYTSSVPNIFAGQINSFGGGNLNLKEEEAKTLTVGGVYQPSWLEGLNFSIDWYRVEITDAISNIDADVILQGCYNGGITSFCSFVLRNPTSGGLSGDPSYGLLETEQNIAFIQVEGVDFAADYLVDAGNFGSIDLSFVATHLSKNSDKPAPGVQTNVCKGKWGPVCDSPSASVRFLQRTDWYFGDFNLGYRWRFIRGSDYEEPGVLVSKYESLADVHYVDLIFGWTPSGVDMLDGFEFQLGIENVFDADPPISGMDVGPTDQNSGNTWPGTYDTVGRSLTMRATKKF